MQLDRSLVLNWTGTNPSYSLIIVMQERGTEWLCQTSWLSGVVAEIAMKTHTNRWNLTMSYVVFLIGNEIGVVIFLVLLTASPPPLTTPSRYHTTYYVRNYIEENESIAH
jgi:hypothetical protein